MTLKDSLFKWNEMKRKTAYWREKVFANDISNNELISQNYKEFLQLSIKTNKQPDVKIGRGPE